MKRYQLLGYERVTVIATAKRSTRIWNGQDSILGNSLSLSGDKKRILETKTEGVQGLGVVYPIYFWRMEARGLEKRQDIETIGVDLALSSSQEHETVSDEMRRSVTSNDWAILH